ncbi:MAG TPA: class I SAM-dependent methyltransferase [Pyrinomonadaceae bacterium]|nr:class I SAM-dependent methyltransferase [Pyrinomonadaceae bacterium]
MARPVDLTECSKELQLLLRLFLYQALVPRAQVEGALGPRIFQIFVSLGLLGTGEFGQDQVYAQVLLYPVAGFIMASDRQSNPDASTFEPPADVVFPAIYEGTFRFLRVLPTSPAEDGLDLCSGSGIGAFVLGRRVNSVVSADITTRAFHFAAFNRALNDCAGVEVVCGDLYEPVTGRTFDRIVAHPPYVPSTRISKVWRDGGATGELLVRRIVEGLPSHLRPGGLFCMISIGLDTAHSSFEQRARGWLGNKESEFDIIFAWKSEKTPRDTLRDLAERDSLSLSELQVLREEFDRVRIVNMPYGALFIRRHPIGWDKTATTDRRKLSEETNGDDFESAFVLHDRFELSSYRENLSDVKLLLAPDLEVKVTHVVHEGQLLPADYLFETVKPFSAMARLDQWMVPLVTSFDGQLTGRSIFEEAKANGHLPDGFELESFTELLVKMIDRGFLRLPPSLD